MIVKSFETRLVLKLIYIFLSRITFASIAGNKMCLKYHVSQTIEVFIK